jgi:hypothetical protein
MRRGGRARGDRTSGESCGPPQSGSSCCPPAAGSRGEQEREQINDLSLLDRSQQLEPRRLEHDFVAISYGAQRNELAAAARNRIRQSVRRPAEEPDRIGVPAGNLPPRRERLLTYICRFSAPKLTRRSRNLRDTYTHTTCNVASTACTNTAALAPPQLGDEVVAVSRAASAQAVLPLRAPKADEAPAPTAHPDRTASNTRDSVPNRGA